MQYPVFISKVPFFRGMSVFAGCLLTGCFWGRNILTRVKVYRFIFDGVENGFFNFQGI